MLQTIYNLRLIHPLTYQDSSYNIIWKVPRQNKQHKNIIFGLLGRQQVVKVYIRIVFSNRLRLDFYLFFKIIFRWIYFYCYVVISLDGRRMEREKYISSQHSSRCSSRLFYVSHTFVSHCFENNIKTTNPNECCNKSVR